MNLGKTLFALRAMSFAQLTYRGDLHDIETCLLTNQTKLYGMGFRSPVKTLDAGRCQRRARLAHLGRFGDYAYPGVRASCIAKTVWVSVSPRTRMKSGSVRV